MLARPSVAVALLVLTLTLSGCAPRHALAGTTAVDVDAAILDILNAAGTASELTDGYSSVWSRAIQSGSDFNDALREQRDSPKVKGKVQTLEQQFGSAGAKLRALAADRLPDDVFNHLADAYELLARLRLMAVSPTGTLQSFNANTADLTNRLGGAVSRVKLYLPMVAQ